jgi:hypothetical protein
VDGGSAKLHLLREARLEEVSLERAVALGLRRACRQS